LIGLALISFFLLVSFITPTQAWINSPKNVPNKYHFCSKVAKDQGIEPKNRVKFFWNHYNMPIDPTYEHFYSTHDYIAHFAIDYLDKSDPSGKYHWLADKSRKYLYTYLLATEYPDITTIKPDLILDCGKSTQVTNYFPRWKESHDLTSLRNKANTRGEQAQKMGLNIHWCQTGAFFLGAMTHYLADASHPCHATGLVDENFHRPLESQVSILTTVWDYRNNNIGNRFFTIDLESILGYNSTDLKDDLNGWYCVDMLAKITADNRETFFNGTKGDGSWNTTVIYQFYKNHNMKGKHFEDLGRYSEEYKDFFDRLEILLNWAVYWTACALKHYLKNFNGVCPDCQEEEDEPSKDKDNLRTPPPPDEMEFISRFGAFFALILIGGLIGKKLFPTKFR
jgi:hypothetical protein